MPMNIMICVIVSAFKKVFDHEKKCFLDEFERPKSDAVVYHDNNKKFVFTQNFHNLLLTEMTAQLEGLTVVSDGFDGNNLVRLNYRDCEVVMDYSVDYWGNNRITFTKLPFAGDTRNFEDY